MKKLFTIALILMLAQANAAFHVEAPENKHQSVFRKAYLLYPGIPSGMLEAVAFTQTRFEHRQEVNPPSCIGYPRTYGVMGLVQDGKGYFRSNLTLVAELSGFSETAIKENAETSVLAYASAFRALQIKYGLTDVENLAAFKRILLELSELPLAHTPEEDFVLNTHLYQIYWFLNTTVFQEAYGFRNYELHLSEIFGSENFKVLSASHVYVGKERVMTQDGAIYRPSGSVATLAAATAAPDYGPAIWNPTTCNFSSRNGAAITAVAIHDVEGSYAGCISWFKNCSANASAHYVIRSSDGQITQMVYEADKAWHIGSENPYTLGIEHEGYNNNAAWYTNAMYNASALLVKDMCADNGINPLRTYYGPGCSGTTAQCGLGACTKVKGHQMYPNQTHNDPGPFWNWDKYYRLINNTYSLTTYTVSSGSFYDSGGASANYSNDERRVYLFTKAGTSNITLNFTQFNLESGWDNLFIYDGGNINAPLIGKYTGTVNPGPIVSNNDSLTVEFRSDCATTAPGWAATFTMNAVTAPTTTDGISPNTTVATLNAWKTAPFTATITDVDNVGGSGVEKGYYQVIDYNGTEWRANYTRGFLADNFDNAIHPEWTQAVGNWTISGNALVQTDELSTAAGNTNLYASLTQTLSNRYLYHFLAKFEGSGASRRGGFHFACDNAALPNRNNSYFVWFRLDDQKVEIYKTVNDVIGTPKVSLSHTFTAGQWYDVKVIYDRISGKITVYWNNAPIATWTDATPYANGNAVSFRSGNCKMSIDEIKVYRSRPSMVAVLVGNGMSNDMRYRNPGPLQFAGKVKSICQDSAGNLSPIYYHDVNVDWTSPALIATVNDGPGTDINLVYTTDSLRANWTPSADSNSAVVRYWYSIGTAPGSTNTLGWTSNWGATSVTAHSLNLIHNTIYYFNVKAENGAGLFSPVTSSNGQKVDTTSGTVGIRDYLPEAEWDVYPNPFSNHLTVKLSSEKQSEFRLRLVNALGQEIKTYTLTVKDKGVVQSLLLPETLPSGMYWFEIKGEGAMYYKKLLRK
ncbi:MAG: N-acetylmuramoyl-L-alanine amidase [Sediminibacterium sp.]|nr:N-acetylmuramoyl-L-alanine amidase [Sediminibacterium sp.]